MMRKSLYSNELALTPPRHLLGYGRFFHSNTPNIVFLFLVFSFTDLPETRPAAPGTFLITAQTNGIPLFRGAVLFFYIPRRSMQ
jgi:hypothetical protein